MAFGLLIGADGKINVGSDGTVGMGDAGKDCCCDCVCPASPPSSVTVDVTGTWDTLGGCLDPGNPCVPSTTSFVIPTNVGCSYLLIDELDNYCIDSKTLDRISIILGPTTRSSCDFALAVTFREPDGSAGGPTIQYISDTGGNGGLLGTYSFYDSDCGTSANFPATITVS